MLRAAALTLTLTLLPAMASADTPKCIDVQFTPTDGLQIVVWIETVDGTPFGSSYYDTLFVTQQVGTYGLGNRPGRYDFNSGPIWPYGRRITTFPVWSHRNGKKFPAVLFQNDINEDPEYCQNVTEDGAFQSCGENNLSHPFNQSSRETHFCRPLMFGEQSWDTATCATTAFTDKGRFSTDLAKTTGYPPRTDITRATPDSDSVSMFKLMNPFDAVSQPTPIGGALAHAPWPVPAELPSGNYIMFVEASKEFDFNGSFGPAQYPSPANLFWNDYGKPYRGQPSVVYTVPFTISDTATTATTQTYFGHGDPLGAVGDITPASPADNITIDTPGSGASRLQLVSDGGDMYRVRVDVRPKDTFETPGMPGEMQPVVVGGSNTTVSFVAPGIGAAHTRVTGYEIRVRANDEMTAANFADSMPTSVRVVPEDPGHVQTVDINNLLPETEYWIGVRAFDGCHNLGELAITKITTTARIAGAVDACFVATAAYGSVMANDVELLRHFRDAMLQSTVLGELGVEAYYTFGPLVAGVVGESDLLRASARDILAPIVARVREVTF
jgi:hypothetical protein